MIELIFVIVIIGILAAVAIPKLAANRDDAEASTCTHEVGQLIQEISAEYTKQGNAKFIAEKVSEMTNIGIVTVTGATKGIAADGLVHGTNIDYQCDGVKIVDIDGANALPDYNLTITVTNGTTPASKKASDAIKENIGTDAAGKKIYTL
jgi:general secretion pathway protein G